MAEFKIPRVGDHFKVLDHYSPHVACGMSLDSIVRVTRVQGVMLVLVWVACPGCGEDIGYSYPTPFCHHFEPVTPLSALAGAAE